MPCLPSRFAALILTCALSFLQRTWRYAQVMLTSPILVPGQRTVTSMLRIMCLKHERRFVNFHRMLNWAAWCPRAVSCTLYDLLVAAFAPRASIVLENDDTFERRRGKPIATKGTYCDPVRSSHGHFVKASGPRWLSLMIASPVENHLREARVGSAVPDRLGPFRSI